MSKTMEHFLFVIAGLTRNRLLIVKQQLTDFMGLRVKPAMTENEKEK